MDYNIDAMVLQNCQMMVVLSIGLNMANFIE
jgi:hypothetical protein